jgi:hypothetical protein
MTEVSAGQHGVRVVAWAGLPELRVLKAKTSCEFKDDPEIDKHFVAPI